MKFLKVSFIASVLMALTFSGNTAAQNTKAVSIKPESTYHPIPPVTFPTRYDLPSSQEIFQSLSALSPAERESIEAEVNPPAIGMVRTLTRPIIFNTNTAPLPDKNAIKVAGGLLSRLNADSLVYTTTIRSTGADEVRVYFEEGTFPENVQVNLFGEDDKGLTLPLANKIIDPLGYYAPTIFSDQVRIQIIMPMSSLKQALRFSITGVVHVETAFLPESTCFEDANCSYAGNFSGIYSLQRAAARLLYVKSGLYYACSGGLLNDTRPSDFQPFLLTANHCFST